MNGKQLKNSILQWAIQGKLVPQDPNDEPASILLEKIRQEKEFGMRALCAPSKGKSIRLFYTFALTGRSYICLPQPRAPLRLPWAKYFWAFSPHRLTRCKSET